MSISLTTLVQKFLDLHHQQHQHLYEHDVHAGGAEKEFVTNNNNNNSSNNNILSSSSNNNSNNSSNSNSNETYGFKTVSRIPRTKIELHLHLDGSIRTSTILDLAKERGLSLPASTVEELSPYVTVPSDCTSLTTFLSTFGVFLPVIVGSAEAIERIAYELCQDEAEHGVCYFEARYAPHLLADASLSPAQVVEAINRGLHRGMTDFTVYAKSILCCMRHMPETSMEVVELAHKYKDQGVVGIDLAGDEAFFSAVPHAPAFLKAKEYNLNRTVHAGEAGPAGNVTEAIDLLHAQRIGHGYHIIDDKKVYDRVKTEDIHIECCLTSSLQTGAVKSAAHHPILKFSSDRLNFSLSSDDAGVCGTNIHQEHILALSKFNLDYSILSRSTLNAAKSCFLPDDEKEILIDYLCKLQFPAGMSK